MFRRYCIQNVKDGIQIQVYNVINESVYHSSQFTLVKFKKNLRESQVQFREKLRKLRLRQNNDFLIKKTCIYFNYRKESNKNFKLKYCLQIPCIQINS